MSGQLDTQQTNPMCFAAANSDAVLAQAVCCKIE